MTHKMNTNYWLTAIVAAGALLLAGCSPGGGDIGNPMSASDKLFAEGIAHISKGEFEEARAAFNQLVDEPEYECRANYGLVLAGVQDTAERLDVLADGASIFLSGAPAVGAPGYQPAQAIDLLPIVENLLEPFEEFFEEILVGLDYVVENECKVTVEDGMPVEIGNPNSLVYVRAVFGYEFDAAAARAGQIIFTSALAGIKMVLAHEIEIDYDDLVDVLNTIIDSIRGTLALEVNGPGNVTQTTAISAIRSLGAIPDANPNLLKLADADRFAAVDNDILRAFRAFYYADANTTSGLVPQLEKESRRDTDPTNNFLGMVEEVTNNTLDEGDSIVIGIRELHVLGLLSMPELGQGVWLNMNPGLGDIEDILAAIHEVAQVVGDQIASVDDSGVSFRRLGLQEANELIEAITILDVLIDPLPEAVEFDFGAYFKNPVGIREMFPYWIDHDNNDETRAELLIEGESWVTTTAEPYVSFGDVGHFNGTYSFDFGDGDVQTLDNLAVTADAIEPTELSILVPFPLPYVAYQDPSFNGILYVDVDKLPIAPDAAGNGMVVADQYSTNKAATSYFRFILEEWIFQE